MASRSLCLLLIFSVLCTAIAELPPSCKSIECPNYSLVEESKGFEIRRYNSTVWMSTSTIQDISFTGATRTGFLQLFNYISGKNDAEKKIEMTAPVLTEIVPSDGPFCESSFVVSFFVPEVNQRDPPEAEGLHAQRWAPSYVAVRQFGGFADDYNIGKEAAALKASLAGTPWYTAVEKSRKTAKSDYVVAQYNAPFEFQDRVNEIWLAVDDSAFDL
ncbi:hypothetical protein V2J09_015283 [Rumex salicifolius]